MNYTFCIILGSYMLLALLASCNVVHRMGSIVLDASSVPVHFHGFNDFPSVDFATSDLALDAEIGFFE